MDAADSGNGTVVAGLGRWVSKLHQQLDLDIARGGRDLSWGDCGSFAGWEVACQVILLRLVLLEPSRSLRANVWGAWLGIVEIRVPLGYTLVPVMVETGGQPHPIYLSSWSGPCG